MSEIRDQSHPVKKCIGASQVNCGFRLLMDALVVPQKCEGYQNPHNSQKLRIVPLSGDKEEMSTPETSNERHESAQSGVYGGDSSTRPS